MLVRRERTPPQREHDVLDEEAAPGMKMTGIAAKNSQQQHGAECTAQPRREEMRDGDGDFHLFLGLAIGNVADFRPGLHGARGEGRIMQIVMAQTASRVTTAACPMPRHWLSRFPMTLSCAVSGAEL